jgi:signal transduction histidine kinase
MGAVAAVWIIGLVGVFLNLPAGTSRMVAADVYTRYSLAIPGAVLTVWGLIIQRGRFIQAGMGGFGRDVAFAALFFGLYGGIGQLFVASSAVFPSEYLNADVFVRTFGFPIQVFRAVMACFAAIFIIRSMRAFEVENRRRIDALREAQLEERRRLEAVREELLHRTVKAQEAERQRIARELHDETGQSLTALGMGLRGLSQTIPTNSERAVQQAQHLEKMAVHSLQDLQRLVTGLHPPQLDDLGLMAALRWYAGEVTRNYGLPVTLNGVENGLKLTPDERVVFFRIAQEAITNIIRHADATQASILLESSVQGVRLVIEDNGKGFNVGGVLDQGSLSPHWGLLGMIERAALVGGTCKITSSVGQGTCVEVSVAREAGDG